MVKTSSLSWWLSTDSEVLDSDFGHCGLLHFKPSVPCLLLQLKVQLHLRLIFKDLKVWDAVVTETVWTLSRSWFQHFRDVNLPSFKRKGRCWGSRANKVKDISNIQAPASEVYPVQWFQVSQVSRKSDYFWTAINTPFWYSHEIVTNHCRHKPARWYVNSWMICSAKGLISGAPVKYDGLTSSSSRGYFDVAAFGANFSIIRENKAVYKRKWRTLAQYARDNSSLDQTYTKKGTSTH